jgi:predicted HAD superfamily Cof-like phosphohydrolase
MYNDVVKFIEACDQEKTKKNQQLYNTLIGEEYDEFIEACVENDEVERLDACMDMIWVILGYCYMKGYDVQGAWKEVARSNLAKIDSTTGKVKKREDGKVLKPEGWTPPNLKEFTKQKKIGLLYGISGY